ncbi:MULTISPECIES: ABC transporter substrate-binding protein [unclassified Haladaptatus]|uniref:ABC transporter substrate-binding protein n=1 Tax=unclassified Haladaptatus TaxID=2622732 RepID=UPI0023E83655|nr:MULTISPECIES: ABC transporter substrate-binding protein [unclassified Haladaptatus]
MARDIIEYDINRRQFLAMTGALTGASLAGCTGDSESGGNGTEGSNTGSGSGSTGGTVRLNVAIASEPWNFDPALWADTGSSAIGSLIYDEVIELTPDSELAPGLVEEVPKPTNDGLAFDYTLREGLQFHNGDDVTVEDFKYSVDWILNPDNNSPIRRRIPNVEGTEIVDDRTLRLNLTTEFATLNWWLTRGLEGIVQKGSRGSASEREGPTGIATNLTTDPSGAGTGPFKFVEWNTNENVLLKKNENYWKDGIPKVDEINFQIMPEDSTRLANLRSGTTDLTTSIPDKDFESLQNDPNIKTGTVPGNTTEVLYMNLMEADGNPMSNVNNRRAVQWGIDAEEILDEIFYGRGVAQQGLWYPDSEWTSPKLKEMEMYDPDKARQELEKAGNPDGFTFEMLITKGSHLKDQGVVIQNQLSKIGIDVEITTLEKSALFDQVYNTTDWHAALENWTNAVPVVTYWLSTGFVPNDRNHNNWHHASPDLPDRYAPSGPPAPEDAEGDFSNGHDWYVQTVKKAQRTVDEQEQKEIVYRLQEYLVENAIQIDIAYSSRLAAWSDAASGYEMGSFSSDLRPVTKD